MHKALSLGTKMIHNPNRKAHLSGYLRANLAFRWPLTSLTPSVFHADQLDGGTFLIWTLGLELQGASPNPMGHPNISKAWD